MRTRWIISAILLAAAPVTLPAQTPDCPVATLQFYIDQFSGKTCTIGKLRLSHFDASLDVIGTLTGSLSDILVTPGAIEYEPNLQGFSMYYQAANPIQVVNEGGMSRMHLRVEYRLRGQVAYVNGDHANGWWTFASPIAQEYSTDNDGWTWADGGRPACSNGSGWSNSYFFDSEGSYPLPFFSTDYWTEFRERDHSCNNSRITEGLSYGIDPAQDPYSSAVGFEDRYTEYVVYVATPEPSTWALLVIGFGAVGLVGSKRRQRH